MFCNHCGTELADDCTFCSHCGMKTDTPNPYTASMKGLKIAILIVAIAAILAIIFLPYYANTGLFWHNEEFYEYQEYHEHDMDHLKDIGPIYGGIFIGLTALCATLVWLRRPGWALACSLVARFAAGISTFFTIPEALIGHGYFAVFICSIVLIILCSIYLAKCRTFKYYTQTMKGEVPYVL